MPTMKKVTLQFDNILLLIDFLDVTKNYECTFNRPYLTVTCSLNQADIELALHGYQAKILHLEEANKKA